MAAFQARSCRLTAPAALSSKSKAARVFGVKPAMSSTRMMASYTVTLKTPDGEKKLTVADDVYILDAAEARPRSQAGQRHVARCAGQSPSEAPPAAGGWPGSAVLLPRGRLLVLRGQGRGARGAGLIRIAPSPPRCIAH